MAGSWPDAAWGSADVSYQTGVLYLRDARHFSVGPGPGCEALPAVYHFKWHRLPAGRADILGD